ncbi:hypothetical protein E2986_11014 [Frieseomelitta varia]|uniref:Complex III subunit 9 n=1 Tax=Frieseomelitta varia TaxID=561572 RepID=A0A833RZ77_9HYME|nr:hypothetical protein E2986_11014 [Frieseomelitta varia]
MASFLYNVLFKRSSTFTVTILVSCFIFERGLDLVADQIFEQVNQGVCLNT